MKWKGGFWLSKLEIHAEILGIDNLVEIRTWRGFAAWIHSRRTHNRLYLNMAFILVRISHGN